MYVGCLPAAFFRSAITQLLYAVSKYMLRAGTRFVAVSFAEFLRQAPSFVTSARSAGETLLTCLQSGETFCLAPARTRLCALEISRSVYGREDFSFEICSWHPSNTDGTADKRTVSRVGTAIQLFFNSPKKRFTYVLTLSERMPPYSRHHKYSPYRRQKKKIPDFCWN